MFVRTQGVLKTIPFYQQIIVNCYSLIVSLFKLIKETYQPAMIAMQSEIATLRGTIARHCEKNETLEAKYLEEVTKHHKQSAHA